MHLTPEMENKGESLSSFALQHGLSVVFLIVENQWAPLLVPAYWSAEVKNNPSAFGIEPASEERLPAIGFIYPKKSGISSAKPAP